MISCDVLPVAMFLMMMVEMDLLVKSKCAWFCFKIMVVVSCDIIISSVGKYSKVVLLGHCCVGSRHPE